MLLIDNDSPFSLTHRPNVTPLRNDFLFIYKNNKIGLTLENTIPIFENNLILPRNIYCFGTINHHQCLLWENNIDNLKWEDTRLSYSYLTTELYQALAIGSHLYQFRESHRYCGKCAALMIDKMDELALICTSCTYISYPKISPCVIVLITRGKEMLLARSSHFRPNMMSALAGFVSIGETIEQAVVREIKEEVGLEIKNLTYICSQPWPFSESLMLGFTAEYLSGDLIIDDHEIESAGWFDKDNLPLLPSEMSIARYLIQRHLNLIKQRGQV